MQPTRRTILTTGLAGTLAALLPVPGLRHLAFAQSPAACPILIGLHQRGG